MSQQHPSATPAQGRPESIRALPRGAQGLGKGVEQALGEPQVLPTPTRCTAREAVCTSARVRGAARESQQSLQVMKEARSLLWPAPPTTPVPAGRHPTLRGLQR